MQMLSMLCEQVDSIWIYWITSTQRQYGLYSQSTAACP